MRFVAVEFPEDPNVVGLKYWYLCPFAGVSEGMRVAAPLGRHNRVQSGVVREVRFGTEDEAPYPVRLIKSIKAIEKSEQEGIDKNV